MTQVFIETNAADVFQAIQDLLRDIPLILDQDEATIRSLLQEGLTAQFDALSGENTVADANGIGIAWYGISDMTAAIREDFWNVNPYFPLMVVTGALRDAVTGGATIVTRENDGALLTYIPSQDQADKIEKHERGFTVDYPVAVGRYSHPRPMVFWGESLAAAAVAALERGLDNLARHRGFR